MLLELALIYKVPERSIEYVCAYLFDKTRVSGLDSFNSTANFC
jgi:hypothetical protein